MSNEIKEIIFDFDGTLADTFDLSIEILNKIKGEFGFGQISKERVDEFRNSGFKDVIKSVHIPIFKLPWIIKKHQKEMEKELIKIKIFPQMDAVLKELKLRGYVLGVLTSNSKNNVKKVFDNNRINYFDYIYSGKNIFGKDKKLKSIIKSRGLVKEQVVYIGDEVRDIEACKKAGIKIVAVAWGYNSKEALEKLRPEYLINKPEEILKIFTVGNVGV